MSQYLRGMYRTDYPTLHLWCNDGPCHRRAMYQCVLRCMSCGIVRQRMYCAPHYHALLESRARDDVQLAMDNHPGDEDADDEDDGYITGPLECSNVHCIKDYQWDMWHI